MAGTWGTDPRALYGKWRKYENIGGNTAKDGFTSNTVLSLKGSHGLKIWLGGQYCQLNAREEVKSLSCWRLNAEDLAWCLPGAWGHDLYHKAIWSEENRKPVLSIFSVSAPKCPEAVSDGKYNTYNMPHSRHLSWEVSVDLILLFNRNGLGS